MIRKIKSLLLRTATIIQRLFDYRNYYYLGIPFTHFIMFAYNMKNGVYTTRLLRNQIKITNQFWFLHSLKEIFIDKTYLFKASNEAPYIIDCGANWGLSVIYFKTLYPKSKIVAFEADKVIYNYLVDNVRTFNYSDVSLINKIVWSEDTVLEFTSDGSLGGSISLLDLNETGKSSEAVGAISLAGYLKDQKVDFLKIDIEGAEFEVLNSCKEYLTNVEYMFVEYHSSPGKAQMLPELLAIIKAAGFRFYVKEAWNNMRYPFMDNRKKRYYDIQLNVFCFR